MARLTEQEMNRIIQHCFNDVMENHAGKRIGAIDTDTILLDSGLDSLGFAILVARLEDELGYDPFTQAQTAHYPQTFGEFVNFYFQHQP